MLYFRDPRKFWDPLNPQFTLKQVLFISGKNRNIFDQHKCLPTKMCNKKVPYGELCLKLEKKTGGRETIL